MAPPPPICQSVKTSNEGPPECSRSPRRRSSCVKQAFSGVSQNTLWRNKYTCHRRKKQSSHIAGANWFHKRQFTPQNNTFQIIIRWNILGVNVREIMYPFHKTSISPSELLTSEDETILFESSNTCVWHVKQYCLTSETILFRGIIIHIRPCFGISMHAHPHEYS